LFDGHTLPCADASVDVVVLVDVLHHCDDPLAMLAEARRAAALAIVIKDHLSDAVLATTTLRFMDRVGNRRHGVPLPYNYWRKSQWHDAFEKLHLHVDEWRDRLRLYPWPASLCFDRSLHFMARLHLRRMDAQ
jgi:SAM-dependent methyltransferase